MKDVVRLGRSGADQPNSIAIGRAEKIDSWASSAPREESAVCGNPECSRGWMTVWKDRRRPMFERKWGCSGRCMKKLVELAVRRESGGGGDRQEAGPHRHRVPLGLVLLAQGLITNPQLQHALEAQRRAGSGRIGHWLVAECGLKEERVTRALGVQWSCPVLSLEGFDPAAMALTVPRVLVEKLGLVPLRVAVGRTLYLAFEDQMDASAALAMERMSGLKVESGLLNGEQLKTAWERLLACDFVDATCEEVADVETMAAEMAAALCELRPRASRLVRVHQFFWMRMWLESGAMSTRDGGIPVSRQDVADRVYSIASQGSRSVTAF